MRPRSIEGLVLLALILTNVAIKLLWIGATELAHDEPFTVYWSQRPVAELWAMLATENNPPLWFFLIKGWSAITPFTAEWLRVPSALFSALTVWPLYLLARRADGARTAVLAALLFTLNNHHLGFAHEVRAYALFALLSTTGMWSLWRWKGSGRSGWVQAWPLVVIDILLVYTHFFGWLAVGLQLLCLLLPEFRPIRSGMLRVFGITVAAYLPYAAVFLGRLNESVSQGTWLTPPTPEEVYNMIWRWSNAPVLAVAFLVIILAAVFRSRPLDAIHRFVLIWTFVPLFGMFLVSYLVPVFLDRYLIYAAPGFALLVALSTVRLGLPKRYGVVLSGVIVAGMAVTFRPSKDTGRHPSQVVAQVDALCDGSCSIEIVPRWYWLNYIAARNIDALRNDLSHVLGTGEQFQVNDSTRTSWTDPDPDNLIVVDAGVAELGMDRSWRAEYAASHPQVDSVEADHKVRVYRFRR
ncbi:MAG: glycosyltransferase family 39 protein [Flavobacteriales bacterium]|nr:glycosyltransferase family 39 protein [Flavobacteriales bacterium]